MTFVNVTLGLFLGFGFGVGCALAVLYSIFRGGYRKAVEESLMEPQPERYRKALGEARRAAPGREA